MEQKTYSQRLADRRWQQKRTDIYKRDHWKCQAIGCTSTTEQLEVHHLEYFEGRQPWEYDNASLITVCHTCHQKEQLRFKHEGYLLNSLKFAGFLSGDLVTLSCAIEQDKSLSKYLKRKIRKFAGVLK